MITKSILSAAALLALGTAAMAEPTGIRQVDAMRPAAQSYAGYSQSYAGYSSFGSAASWNGQRNWKPAITATEQAEIDRSNGSTIER